MFKLHTSAIFKRKPSHMLSLGKRTFLFTKIKWEELLTGAYDTELSIHKVTVLDDELYNSFMSYLPFMSNRGAVVKLAAMLSLVNKISTKKTYTREDLQEYNLDLYDKEKNEFNEVISTFDREHGTFIMKVVSPKMSLSAPIGYSLSEEHIRTYENMFKQYEEREMKASGDLNDMVKKGSLAFDSANGTIHYEDGINTVSITEYIKKVDDPGKFKFISMSINRSYQYKTIFENKYIRVESIQPLLTLFT